MKRLSRNVSPLRAAVAPTASPNAIMPGSTGSASRAPRLKPARETNGTRAEASRGLLMVLRFYRAASRAQGSLLADKACTRPPSTHSNACGSSSARALRHAVQDHVLLAEFESRIGPGLDVVAQRLRPLLPIVAVHTTVRLRGSFHIAHGIE